MIHVTVEGTEALSAKLLALPETIRTRALAGMAQIAHETAFREADKHTKQGALIRSLEMKPFADGWEIGHDLRKARHALFVHWGTRKHPIPKPGKPMRKKALRWPTSDGFAFAKHVNHPGYKGDPWLVQAGEEAIAAFDHIVSRLQGTL